MVLAGGQRAALPGQHRTLALRWDQVDLKAGHLAVVRRKNGVPPTHPLRGPELRALRQLRRDWPNTPYLFVSERGGPMSAGNVRKLDRTINCSQPCRTAGLHGVSQAIVIASSGWRDPVG